MRNWINLLEDHDDDLTSTLWTVGDWLNGDAMSLINDEGERFSPKPYYDAMKAIAARVPGAARDTLTGTLYRGVGFDDVQDFQSGKVKTALKKMQSWSPNFTVAEEFAKDYGGRYGVVFSADVQKNRRAIVLCVSDVLSWLKTKPAEIDPRYFDDILYQFERYEQQQEVILRGSSVHITAAKVVKRPRKR
jgi:hypothetical protein